MLYLFKPLPANDRDFSNWKPFIKNVWFRKHFMKFVYSLQIVLIIIATMLGVWNFANLTEELVEPDKQVRLELWAYDPKQFADDNNADDISVVLSFQNTNDERIEEAIDELKERRLQG